LIVHTIPTRPAIMLNRKNPMRDLSVSFIFILK
jgi:hypothetical protein